MLTYLFIRHLKSHVHEEYIDVDQLSEPQMIMQHFRNYDLDKNGNIDGLEILKAAHKMNGKFFLATSLIYSPIGHIHKESHSNFLI